MRNCNSIYTYDLRAYAQIAFKYNYKKQLVHASINIRSILGSFLFWMLQRWALPCTLYYHHQLFNLAIISFRIISNKRTFFFSHQIFLQHSVYMCFFIFNEFHLKVKHYDKFLMWHITSVEWASKYIYINNIELKIFFPWFKLRVDASLNRGEFVKSTFISIIIMMMIKNII